MNRTPEHDATTAGAPEHLDVLIVGAGISGIDAAYRLQTECPGKRFALLEAREAIGGTWDFFRYPGIRSDSDMSTLGFPFRPWRAARALAAGDEIRDYVQDTARQYGIDRQVRLGWRVVRAAWCSREARWTVDVQVGPEQPASRLTCDFLYLCSGYYDYARGHSPTFPGAERFGGRIVHPQDWPADLDYSGQRVVVIGSGATAVTLVPALTERATHVTLLQRSPTYIVSRPRDDRLARWAQANLPATLADRLVRWANIGLGIATYRFCRTFPERARAAILAGVRRALGPGHDVERHFTPRYKPWDQRICLVPDGDLFRALRQGKASIATDRIEHFTETGVQLAGGDHLDADLIVTATGLVLKMAGGAELEMDGRAIDPARRMVYRGMMLEGVPNLAIAFGYSNASWTLRCDLTARHVCRLLNYMDRHGYRYCLAPPDASLRPRPLLDFSSGYVRRADAVLPRQGSRAPWRVHQNYLLDWAAFVFGRPDDGVMRFFRTPAKSDRTDKTAITEKHPNEETR
ncbi:flavin-containing monooxygenase [Stutzerimonas urumqiensis]|uniref:flavin-containing monooxygenase n=1 Tax=Stutzerimonas urumqiensis TaxID=638269 RepID=UPI003BA932C7